mmetsp:Transcript_73364/g.203375  ORF Transcript_73364/g.203375 Transcript_73364/m.203375 type:complete len:86 (-) Transcript_73364:182-439(-)
MDADLKALQLVAPDGSAREVRLSAVEAVHAGTEASRIGLTGAATEERCATIELTTGDCVTFRFADVEQSARFVGCLRVFVSAQRH